MFTAVTLNDNIIKDDAEDEYVYMPVNCFPQDRLPWLNIKLRRDGTSYLLKAKVRHNRLQNKYSVFGPESEIWKLGKLSKDDVKTLSKILFPLETETEAGYRRAWLDSLDADSFKDRDNFKTSMSKYLAIMRASRQGLTPDSDEFRRLFKTGAAVAGTGVGTSSSSTTSAKAARGAGGAALDSHALPPCQIIRVQKRRRKQSVGALDAEFSEILIEPEDGKTVDGDAIKFRTFLVESHDSVPLKQFVEKLEMSHGKVLQGRNCCYHDYISLMDTIMNPAVQPTTHAV